MPKSVADLTDEIYCKISNAIMPCDLSKNAPDPAAFVSVMIPGFTVCPDDDYTEFADVIPAFNRCFVNSNKTCSSLFSLILNAEVPPNSEAETEEKKAEYEVAEEYLTKDNHYKLYREYSKVYNATRNKYLSCSNRDDLEPTKKKTKLGKLKAAMNTAYEDFTIMGYKNKVEAAMATINRYLQYTPETVFSNASKVFDEALDIGTNLYPVSFIPSNWSTKPASLAWTTITISQNSKNESIHEMVKDIDNSTSASLKAGIFSASGDVKYGKHVEQINNSIDMSALEISFELAVVNITRNWFNTSLLTYPSYSSTIYDIGGICGGSMAQAKSCEYPSVPTEFVLARNITISTSFTENVDEHLHEITNVDANAKIGIGPFSIDNSTKYKKETDDKSSADTGNKYTITCGDTVQIIGHVNTILTPKFPNRNHSDD